MASLRFEMGRFLGLLGYPFVLKDIPIYHFVPHLPIIFAMGPAIQVFPPSSKVLSHRSFCNETTRPLSGRRLKSSILRPSSLYYVPNLKLKNRTWSIFNRHVFTSAVGGEEPTTESGAEQAALKEQLVPEGITDGQESLPVDPSDSKQRKQRVPTRSTRQAVVSEEDLVRGAIFKGKVTSIQPYGAFVDLGAFTNGLVHISRLSRSYVKAVEDVVKIGQEVSVQILEVNLDAGHIVLRLREESEELQNQGEGDQSRSSGVGSKLGIGRQVRFAGIGKVRRNNRKIPSKFHKGQKLTGVVKNLVRSGVFVTLPEGGEGFLHSSEVTSGAENVVLQSYFQVGQEVNVRVLEIEKGRLSLTMKQELDMPKLNLFIDKNEKEAIATPPEIQPLPSEKAVIEGTAEKGQEVVLTSDEVVNATVENQGLPTAAEAQVSTSEEAIEEVLEKGLDDDPLTLPTENLEVVQDQDATTVSAVADSMQGRLVCGRERSCY